MAQGLIKKSKPTAPTSKSTTKRPSALGPRKGQGTINPKKAKLAKQHKINKKITSGMTAKTEQTLAKRAGHLEMLGGGKKDSKGGSKK